MDILNTGILEWGVYLITFLFMGFVIYRYLMQAKQVSLITHEKVLEAKSLGRYEPLSLYPFIDTNVCIGSGACVSACPEKDVLGLMHGKGTLINTTSCIGHGACFQACPVDAISLRIGTEKRGVELPHVKPNYETNVPGIFIAGELGGMGLIKNSIEQGIEAVKSIQKRIQTQADSDPEKVYDVLIIGAGPAGIGAAMKAKELGLRSTVLEQDSLGGTVFTYPRSKVVMTHPVELPLYGSVKLLNTHKEELLALWNEIRETYQLDIQEHTRVTQITQKDGVFELLIDGKNPVFGKNIILAIGRRGTPRKLNIPGELSTRVAYRLIEAEHIKGERIVVVGGGDSAIESALLLMDQNEVYLSYRKNAFARIKPLNATKIYEAITGKRLHMLFGSELTEIKEDRVYYSQGERTEILTEIDRIYIFAGGELPIEFLKLAGVELQLAKNKIVKQH